MSEVAFVVLMVIVVAAGVYLRRQSRRSHELLEEFARTHHLQIKPEQKEELQRTLNSCFSDGDLTRRFEQISTPIEGGSFWVFRMVEFFPHISKHFSRIAALFEVAQGHDEFFVLNRSIQVINRHSNTPNTDVTERSIRIGRWCNMRCQLSVTLANGHGLIYFEPHLAGDETMSDLISLCCIARKMHEELVG